MPLKTILAYLPPIETAAPVSKVAVELGERHGSRPVLMVPQAHNAQTVGECIVAGWKPGREAGRGSPAQLRAALARHGVNAKEVVSKTPGAGEALLEQVEALGGDLLVMGCYGRSRLSQLIFGGATRYVLKHMTVPVLMSH